MNYIISKNIIMDLVISKFESLSFNEDEITPTEKKNETRLFIFIYLKTMF